MALSEAPRYLLAALSRGGSVAPRQGLLQGLPSLSPLPSLRDPGSAAMGSNGPPASGKDAAGSSSAVKEREPHHHHHHHHAGGRDAEGDVERESKERGRERHYNRDRGKFVWS